jgi:hypothetical protein
VRNLVYREVDFLLDATPQAFKGYHVGRSGFFEMCRKMSLRRFPAGQFEWEVAGISRGQLARVPRRSMLRVALFVAARMRGLEPVFFSHLYRRRAERSLNEREALRSYFRMAQAMALQPSILGFAACSWFRSPDTHRVSPHLAWLSDVFLQNGGMVVTAGPAPPDGGVLYRSETRRRLYEAGEFSPTMGLVMWPRRAMLAWAAAHPELAS